MSLTLVIVKKNLQKVTIILFLILLYLGSINSIDSKHSSKSTLQNFNHQGKMG